MQKFILFILSSIFISLNISAQQIDYCGTDQEYHKLIQEHPELIQAEIEYEKSIQQLLKMGQAKSGDSEILVIPVVFHVLHDYGDENISDAQIYDAINIMNRDFLKLNADTSLINPEFKDIAASANIQFRLANKTSDGSCTNGINRIATRLTYDGSDQTAKFEQWNRSSYLNIWVARNMDSGVAGFSLYPSSVADQFSMHLDGIMVRYNYVGSMEPSSLNNARTLTHEVGHYLNLQHPWGNTNSPGQACGDDEVEDTPITKGWTHCPDHSDSDVCNPGIFENYQNHMDYSYCTHMFTEGQVARMRAALDSYVSQRKLLVSQENSVITGINNDEPTICAPTVDFYTENNIRSVCAGSSIKFSPLIGNAEADTYAWSFPGANIESSTDAEPTVTYDTEGWKTVTLTAGNSTGSATTTKEKAIYVYGESISTGHFVESFQDENLVRNQWAVKFANTNKLSHDVNWDWSPVGCLDPGSMKLNLFDNPTPERFEVISPKLDLTGKTGQYLSFKYAFATQKADPQDINLSFRVLTTSNCGRARTARLTIQNPVDILTAGNYSDLDFIPTQPNDWKTAKVLINSAMAVDGTQFIFEVTSDFGENNFYIDNINIGEWIVSTEDEEPLHTLNLYPNPANNSTHLEFTLNKSSKIDITIFDLTGKIVKNVASAHYPVGLHSLDIATTDLPAGAYFVQLKGDELQKSLKLMISK